MWRAVKSDFPLLILPFIHIAFPVPRKAFGRVAPTLGATFAAPTSPIGVHAAIVRVHGLLALVALATTVQGLETDATAVTVVVVPVAGVVPVLVTAPGLRLVVPATPSRPSRRGVVPRDEARPSRPALPTGQTDDGGSPVARPWVTPVRPSSDTGNVATLDVPDSS